MSSIVSRPPRSPPAQRRERFSYAVLETQPGIRLGCPLQARGKTSELIEWQVNCELHAEPLWPEPQVGWRSDSTCKLHGLYYFGEVKSSQPRRETMIGRVGRNPQQQLEGILHTLRLKLEEAERRNPRDEADIAAIRRSIESYEQKLAALGR